MRPGRDVTDDRGSAPRTKEISRCPHPPSSPAVAVAVVAVTLIPTRRRRRAGPHAERSEPDSAAPCCRSRPYAPGPPSGRLASGRHQRDHLPAAVAAGRGVLGASLAGREPGEYLAMPDNGFGAKATSRDFLIRAYYIKPDFKTREGGSGDDRGAGTSSSSAIPTA